MISVVKDCNGKEHYTGSYGPQILLDCHECDPSTFNRKNIEKFMIALCASMNMEREDFHFWDDLNTPEEDRMTEPHTKGTSIAGVFHKKIGIQFIITSTIVIHCLDVLKIAFIDIFSCKEFDEGDAKEIVYRFFKAKMIGSHHVVRF